MSRKCLRTRGQCWVSAFNGRQIYEWPMCIQNGQKNPNETILKWAEALPSVFFSPTARRPDSSNILFLITGAGLVMPLIPCSHWVYLHDEKIKITTNIVAEFAFPRRDFPPELCQLAWNTKAEQWEDDSDLPCFGPALFCGESCSRWIYFAWLISMTKSFTRVAERASTDIKCLSNRLWRVWNLYFKYGNRLR